VFNRGDAAIAATTFFLLDRWRVPPVVVVGLCAGAAMVAQR